jgi:hypothetical protein
MKVAMEKTTFYQIEKNPHFGGYGYHLSTNILCQEQEQKKIFCENQEWPQFLGHLHFTTKKTIICIY